MRKEAERQKPKVRNREMQLKIVLLAFFCLLSSDFFLLSCSIPNLEKPDCVNAREATREFYSFHFGNEMKFNQENLKTRQRFLTPELFQMLSQKPDSAIDYFTASEEPPKSFRIGKCEITESDKKTNLEVVLFWRVDDKNLQKEISVEAVKENNKWLVNKVEAK